MLKVRTRSGVVGVTAGAAALLALPVVAAGQVPVVDQVVSGVTQTAHTLAPAAPAGPPAAKPAPPTALPAPPSGVPTGPTSRPPNGAPAALAPRQVTATGAPSAPASGSRGVQNDAGSHGRVAQRDARAAQDDGSQNDSSEGQGSQNDGSQGGSSEGTGSGADDGGATDVEIAAGESGDDAGPATLPFTGFQLALLAMLGLGAIVGGASLRRAV